MNDKPEPRSATKSSNVWHSPFKREKKRLWNFLPKAQRGQIAELPTKIKQIGFNSKIFKFGPYQGSLEDIKEFARMKGMDFVSNGAIKYKIA